MKPFVLLKYLIVLLLVGVGLLAWAYHDWKVQQRSSVEPQAITARDLIRNGPGDNLHVRVTDFTVVEEFVVEGETAEGWERAWFIIKPKQGGGWPIVLQSDDITNYPELVKLAAEGGFQGMAMHSGNRLQSEAKDLLRSYMSSVRTINWNRVRVVHHNQKPAGSMMLLVKFIGGVALIGIGAYSLFSIRNSTLD